MNNLIRLSPYFFVVLLAIVIGVACSKNSSNSANNNNKDPRVTAVANLTVKAWKYDTSGLDTNNSGTITQGGDTTVVPPCQRDDIYTFNSDSTGIVNTGTIHCTVGEPQTRPFTWSLSADAKTLKASINQILQQGVTILKLDSVHLAVYRDSVLMGVSYRYIVQLKH